MTTATGLEREAMQAALALALRGPRGLNPQVGALILATTSVTNTADPAHIEAARELEALGFSAELIAHTKAVGWHNGAGTAHAEVAALAKLHPDAARGATAVVSLEPCNHTGRTGPCAGALLQAGVSRVVHASTDPGADSGGGAQRLRDHGVTVVSGVLKDQADELIADWVHLSRTGLPLVTLKWAQSLDGRAAADDGSSQWITGPDARADVHRRRSLSDVIIAGTGTVLADDPALTARDEQGALLPNQPAPVVIGSRSIPQHSRLFQHPKPVRFFTGPELSEVLRDLGSQGVQRVFVEGGPSLISSFLSQGLVDEVLCYVAPVLLGGSRLALGDIQIKSIGQALRLEIIATRPLGIDTLFIARPVEGAN